jgi:hypothetical protein
LILRSSHILNLLYCVLICLLPSTGKGQQFAFELGSSLSRFDYTLANGTKADYLIPAAGLSFGIHGIQTLLDTSSISASSGKKSIYFNQHPLLRKIVSALHYELGFEYLQMNALGNQQKIPFSYQTDFIGIQAAFGAKIPLAKGFVFSANLVVQGQKMFQGNQLVANQYYSLQENEQFRNIQLLLGYRAEIIKILNDKIAVFGAYQESQTYHASEIGKSTLNFCPRQILIGLRLSK